MMAKVRKKFNKMKQLGRVSQHILKDVLVCYVDRLEGCVMVDRKKGVILKPTEVMVAAASRPHQWSCYISVLGRVPLTGQEYMKSEQILTPSKFYQSDLAPVFEMHHSRLIKNIPEDHLCGVGWIADPFGSELTEQEAGSIFEQLEAWT